MTPVKILISSVLAVLSFAPQAAPQADFARVQAIVRRELADTATPGAAVAVVRGDAIVYSRGFGVANVETGEDVRPDMVFRLGSTTKMFTAATVVLLASQGKLSLDEPVGRHITGLTPKLAALTANQLLSHTSGMLDEAPMFGSHDDESLRREVTGWEDDHLFTEPGAIYSYSNPGYWMAGLLAETVGGRPFADQVAETIFAPVGMAHSSFRPTVAMTFPLAQGHEVANGRPRIVRPAADNAASWPAGSIYSSVLDLSRWMIAFMNRGTINGDRVLPEAIFEVMTEPRASIPGSPSRYGYGVEVGSWRGVDVVRHSGSRSGYGSSILMIPSAHVGVVVLANRSGASLPRTVDALVEAVLPIAPAPATDPREPMALGAADVQAFAGVYSQGGRRIELVARDGTLFLKNGTTETAVMKTDDLELRAGATRIVVVKGPTGSVDYLHSGGRSWRRIR